MRCKTARQSRILFGLEDWTQKFESMGMRVLINAQETVRTEGGSLSILCIADTVALRFRFEGPDIQRASEDAEPGVVKILLSHRPVNTQPHADAGVALWLSGHTHGGMIVGFDQVARHTNDGLVSGMYTIDGMKLYVSKGNGLWNGFLMRLGIPGEIIEFVLRALP